MYPQQLARQRLQAVFRGRQYCACLPGGAEVVGWLSHLLFDQGGMILASDVPGAFPGCSRVRVREAITELVPELLPVFDVTYGHGSFDVVGECFRFSVGDGVGQGDTLCSIFFGILTVYDMTT